MNRTGIDWGNMENTWYSFSSPVDAVRVLVGMSPQHQFVVLTKRPETIPPGWNDDVPNLWVGISDTCRYGNDDRLRRVFLKRIMKRRVLCIEPLLGYPEVAQLDDYDWVIVGGLTGNTTLRPLPETMLHWVECVMADCESQEVPVFLKRNLAPEVPMQYIMAHREYPPELAEVKGGKA